MESHAFGITGFGAYLPRLRLARSTIVAANAWANPGLHAHSQGMRSMCDWDEDAVTMATEAARDCLASKTERAVSSLYLASTTLPFSSRQNSAIVAEALDLPDELVALDLCHSQRCGTSALALALNAAPSTGDSLVVASDHRRTQAASVSELLYGDAAAAVTVGRNDVVAALRGSMTITRDFVDHFRPHADSFDYAWEERWIKQEGHMKLVAPTVKEALKRSGVIAEAVDHFIMPCPIRGVRESIAKQLQIPAGSLQENFMSRCGDSGAAHALLMLVAVLAKAKPGELIVLVGFGQGVDVLVLEVLGGIDNKQTACTVNRQLENFTEELSYSKFQSFNQLVDIDWGARAEVDRKTALSAAYRNRDFFSMTGGRCRQCETVQFPSNNICINPQCGEVRSQDRYSLANETGTIVSVTSDWLAISGHPPHRYGMVRFDCGAKLMMEITSDGACEPQVGMRVRPQFRIKSRDTQRNYRQYFWKATIETQSPE